MTPNEITGQMVDAAIRVHSRLGPGLLESAYKACLVHELRKRGLDVRTEVPVRIVYDGIELDIAYGIDLLVEDTVVVEAKALPRIAPVHEAQLVSQLRLTHHRVGLLINFHELHLKDGIRRKVNGL